MNTRQPELLPQLSDADVERIERELFAKIDEEESLAPAHTHKRARRRLWPTVIGVAAAFAVGVLATPPLLNAVTSVSASMSSDGDLSMNSEGGWATGGFAGSAPDMAESAPEMADTDSGGITGVESQTSVAGGDSATAGREIIASGHASLSVHGVAAASDLIAELATEHGGYVESSNIGQERYYSADASASVPPGGDYGWVSIRVPSAALTEVMGALSDIGEVVTTSVSSNDVTTEAIDLRARVDATRASVERLTELMSQTGSVSELIEAEIALSERQAQLESYQQQLASLENQVAMSSLQIELTRIIPVTQADPAGFTDGFTAGWNGLIVSINALVIAAGFVIPWLAVFGVAALIVWLVIRARRSRNAASGD